MRGKYGRSRPYYGKNVPDLEVLESQILEIADFTNNEDTTGYIDVDTQLPAGAIPLGWKARTLEAFANADVYTPADGTTIAFVDGGAGADTITDSADGFVTAGFEVGDTITVAGSTSNDGDYTLVDVAAGTLTLATGTVTAAEDGIEGISFTGKSTATISVGVSGDLDRFSADTAQNVGAIGTVGAAILAADAADGMASAQTVRVTITEGSDFDEFSEGSMILELYYIKTE